MAVWMRSRGCFSRQRSIRRDTSPGTSERQSRTGFGESLRIDAMSAGDESPPNSRAPVAISSRRCP